MSRKLLRLHETFAPFAAARCGDRHPSSTSTSALFGMSCAFGWLSSCVQLDDRSIAGADGCAHEQAQSQVAAMMGEFAANLLRWCWSAGATVRNRSCVTPILIIDDVVGFN